MVRALARQARGHRFESYIAHWAGFRDRHDFRGTRGNPGGGRGFRRFVRRDAFRRGRLRRCNSRRTVLVSGPPAGGAGGRRYRPPRPRNDAPVTSDSARRPASASGPTTWRPHVPGSVPPSRSRRRPADSGTAAARVLAEHSTDPSFGDLLLPQGPPDGFHRAATTLGASQFGRAASLRINMSRAWSAVSLPKQAHDLLCTASLLQLRTLSNPSWGTRILS